MNTMLDNKTTDNANDLNLADLPPVTTIRYAHLSLMDSTHTATIAPVLPTKRKSRMDWYASGVVVLLLSALATAVDLLGHLK